MASKKTSVRASSKGTNKPNTDKARKAVDAEIRERLASLNGAEPIPEVPTADAPHVDEALATVAPDAAEAAPATDTPKPGKAPRGGTSGKGGKSGKKGEKPAKEPKPPKAKKEKPAKVKKVSCLDAAAQVLAASEVPMRPKEMIAKMAAKGLWTTGKGLTPEATLYAAIIREIAAKGREARFKKHERGVFVAGKIG